jgi:lysozyme family protein
VRHVLNQEGGLSKDRRDKGGVTFKGISTAFYNGLIRKYGYPNKPVVALTHAERLAIYKKWFWKASGADRIEDPALALQVFDHAVNAGVKQADTLLDRGNITPRMYRNARITYYKNRSQCDIYCTGWIARTHRIYDIGLKLKGV